jgi:hypothetical protein
MTQGTLVPFDVQAYALAIIGNGSAPGVWRLRDLRVVGFSNLCLQPPEISEVGVITHPTIHIGVALRSSFGAHRMPDALTHRRSMCQEQKSA